MCSWVFKALTCESIMLHVWLFFPIHRKPRITIVNKTLGRSSSLECRRGHVLAVEDNLFVFTAGGSRPQAWKNLSVHACAAFPSQQSNRKCQIATRRGFLSFSFLFFGKSQQEPKRSSHTSFLPTYIWKHQEKAFVRSLEIWIRGEANHFFTNHFISLKEKQQLNLPFSFPHFLSEKNKTISKVPPSPYI